MYGFHKTNRTPRGQRGDSEHQSWEFSHPMFIRDRPELAASIKRSLNDQESLTKSISNDFQTNLSLMQSAQSELAQQVQNLRKDHNRLVMELSEAKQIQQAQQQLINNLLNSSQIKAYADHRRC
jgi:K+-sensing histidine kinase KdpD